MKQLWMGFLMYMILILPFVSDWMEARMIVHMLLQMPLLIVAGYWMGKGIIPHTRRFWVKWNAAGGPGILVFVFITMYWMLPRAMDEALVLSHVEWFKFISLPIAGICLFDSWKKSSGIIKSFVFLNYLSMFALMGWLYIDSPIQLCNNYLETQQRLLGWGFVLITALMVVYLLQIVFVDQGEAEASE
ncbi:hypothetical protein JNUCC1_02406 [Lentibacillus sp. JNUCC-1]|uniref:hypothetical protein n=1 Tax=Lentibacillus sp. JNUCC-1 TaxID=2654513 RepID=UPI0012E90997|nr:hypothetical protein [Lentibacillus sp. JNUCC-1]MUV38552.1 hypothetical protein [Lentibacillus sp. JNUCC-1]